jgi:hypothetical protein
LILTASCSPFIFIFPYEHSLFYFPQHKET